MTFFENLIRQLEAQYEGYDSVLLFHAPSYCAALREAKSHFSGKHIALNSVSQTVCWGKTDEGLPFVITDHNNVNAAVDAFRQCLNKDV